MISIWKRIPSLKYFSLLIKKIIQKSKKDTKLTIEIRVASEQFTSFYILESHILLPVEKKRKSKGFKDILPTWLLWVTYWIDLWLVYVHQYYLFSSNNEISTSTCWKEFMLRTWSEVSLMVTIYQCIMYNISSKQTAGT